MEIAAFSVFGGWMLSETSYMLRLCEEDSVNRFFFFCCCAINFNTLGESEAYPHSSLRRMEEKICPRIHELKAGFSDKVQCTIKNLHICTVCFKHLQRNKVKLVTLRVVQCCACVK